MRARPLASATAVAALAFLIGCGGYRAARSGPQGRATIRVAWPKTAARLIPASAQSLVVTALKDGVAVGGTTIVRPNASGTLTGLPYGTLGVSIKAYPTTNGTGVAQAIGAGTMTVTEDVPGSVAVTLDSTVATLTVDPTRLTVAQNATTTLIASAKDATGAIVLLASGTLAEALQWSIDPAGIATITGSGPVVTVRGDAVGTVDVTARLKVKDSGETVDATAPLHVLSALVASGLATPGFPVAGGDYGATGRGRGPVAFGSLGGPVSVGTSSAYAVTGPDGTLYAVSNGSLLASGGASWTVPTGVAVRGLTLTDGGVLLVATASGIDARIASTGALAWSFQPTSGIVSAPAVGRDGRVFAFADKLYALDGATGAVVWSKAATLSGRLAIGADGTVYGHSGATVTAFDPASGATVWTKNAFGADTSGTDVVVDGDTLYITTGVVKRSTTRGLSPYDAAPQEDRGPDDDPESRLVTSGITTTISSTGNLGSTTGYPTTYTWYGYLNVTALNSATGAQRWTYALPKYTATSTSSTRAPSIPTMASPVAASNGRVVATGHGYAASLDAGTGVKVWLIGALSASASVVPTAAIAGDGTAYVSYNADSSSASSAVSALDPTTGALRWRASLGAPLVGGLTLADDGTVYAGTANGKVIPVR